MSIFPKGFDRYPHIRPIPKLGDVFVDPDTISWKSRYLLHRQFRVKVNGKLTRHGRETNPAIRVETTDNEVVPIGHRCLKVPCADGVALVMISLAKLLDVFYLKLFLLFQVCFLDNV